MNPTHLRNITPFVAVAMMSLVGVSRAGNITAESLRGAATSATILECSGTCELLTTHPQEENQSVVPIKTGFAIDGEKRFAAMFFTTAEGATTDAAMVAVTTPGVCFVARRERGKQFQVADIGTARSDSVARIEAVVSHYSGWYHAGYRSMFVDLRSQPGTPAFQIRKSEEISPNRVKLMFSGSTNDGSRSGELIYDFGIPGIVSLTVDLKIGEILVSESVDVDYGTTAPTSIPRSVKHTYRADGQVKQETHWKLTNLQLEPPDPAVFDIRTYGIAGPALPSERTVPRWLMAVIAILISCGAYVIRRRMIAARNVA